RLRAERSHAEADQTAQAEAEADQAEFQRDREAFDRAPRPASLDADQQQELKRLYREAAMRCHPDRVTEADQVAAQTIFVQVQRAYQQNDLDTLNRLHRHLTEGQPFADPAQVWTEQEQLHGRMSRLQLEIERWLAEIRALRASETYQTLAAQPDWAAYFARIRLRLEEECEELRQKIAEMSHA
ncbi:MAG: J domain-containing protein, partial [Candidatus Contendobacter sp.]|nr:J domain-containing protein [Candidatus Contendobacter sp.]